MYTPKSFRNDDPTDWYALIRAHNFALIISEGPSGPVATHVPFLLEVDGQGAAVLRGHFARANPQWRYFRDDREVLVVFQGPHAYVSPVWYEDRSVNVPTWNYAAVHVYGVPRIVENLSSVRDLLSALSARHESGAPDPWSIEELPQQAVGALAKGLVAFDIPVSRVEAQFKLSQNRAPADRAGVIRGLDAQGDPGSLATARLMERMAMKSS